MTAIAYIRRETFVSILINTGLSGLFFLAVFGRSGPVPVWGAGGYVFDFGPQGFMIGLMATLVPGVLARKAMRLGRLSTLDGHARLPRGLVLRAMLCGLAGAVAGMAIAAALLAVAGVAMLAWWPAFLVKLVFGAMLAAIVTHAGLKTELVSR
ncbi:MAG: hypothetical protein ACKOVA_02375 [Novosphingobium sp.]